MPSLKATITDAMKAAMKSGDKARLGTIRMILAAIKQIEVDERIELDDNRIIAVLDKMLKQRRESIRQYRDANRQDLAEIEEAEIQIIQDFLPKALSTEEIQKLIDQAISETGASSIKDMGKVMGILKPKMQGRADMAVVSAQIKTALSA
ncbi:GatB/YqeY domain-containing protein [methane-oxidizing endosymbiont of Gigantopelta aegis]|uniref:GatB/YqeY domain-containing protein n=1 Tax=methane-oxidizing endosymbiont of Gigantopelta aegis TaxID=2794938 RepID=UPI0018DD9CE7|nr:GatB/YqeY domain-containing protein [methane-oxidizing endosymbiont of Gigantopelta aegis]